jgi:dihydroorotase
MKSILIVNAQIVNEGTIRLADLLIREGRIDRIDSNLSNQAVDTVIDAKNNIVMPGMIDVHVHFREPGLTHKGDIACESRAAVAGGITSYLEMPNTNPPTTTLTRIEEKCAVAARNSLANYGFYLGASHRNIDEIRRIDPLKVGGIKLFMGASTGNMLVDKKKALDAIFASARIPMAVHCEDANIIKNNEATYRARYGEDVPMRYHAAIRSHDACYQSTLKAVALAKQHGTRLHVLHLSTSEELTLFSDAPLNDKTITAEACVHHLFFDDRDYEHKNTLIKCNPAIKSVRDRNALIEAVTTNNIDTIGTDHPPHTLVEKNNDYFILVLHDPQFMVTEFRFIIRSISKNKFGL